MKKISKSNSEKFNKQVRELIKKYRAIENESYKMYQYQLQTKYGILNVSVHDDQSFIYSIFTRFDEPEKAKEKFSCNPHSGKYNFHCGDFETNINSFESFLKQVI